MLEQLTMLWDIQVIDLALEEIESHKRTKEGELKALDDKLRTLEYQESELREFVEDLSRQIASVEEKLAEDQAKIKKSEDRLFEIKTTEEYEAGLREVENKRIEIEESETILLAKSEEIDRVKQERDNKATLISETRSLYEEKASELSEAAAEASKKCEAKLPEKKNLLEKIDKLLLGKYNFLKKHRQGSVIAACKDTVCLGCFMGIPPQLYYQIQQNRELHTCPNCQRILYFYKFNLDGTYVPEPPPVEAPKKKRVSKKAAKDDDED